MKSLVARMLSTAARHDLLSGNLAIGAAVTFVLATVVLSLSVDRPAPGHVRDDLSLRGTLATQDVPLGDGADTRKGAARPDGA